MQVLEYLCLKDMSPLEMLLDHPDQKMAERLLPLLVRQRGERSFTLFFKMSEHPSQKVRGEAVRILLARDPQSILKLFPLIDDPSIKVRRDILAGIGRQKSSVLENLLLKHINENVDHENTDYILACYAALGRCGSNKAVPYLRRVLLAHGWNRFWGLGKPVHRQGAATITLVLLDNLQTENILLEASKSRFRLIREAASKAMTRSNEWEKIPMVDTAKYRSYSRLEKLMQNFYSLLKTAKIHQSDHKLVINGIENFSRSIGVCMDGDSLAIKIVNGRLAIDDEMLPYNTITKNLIDNMVRYFDIRGLEGLRLLQPIKQATAKDILVFMRLLDGCRQRPDRQAWLTKGLDANNIFWVEVITKPKTKQPEKTEEFLYIDKAGRRQRARKDYSYVMASFKEVAQKVTGKGRVGMRKTVRVSPGFGAASDC